MNLTSKWSQNYKSRHSLGASARIFSQELRLKWLALTHSIGGYFDATLLKGKGVRYADS